MLTVDEFLVKAKELRFDGFMKGGGPVENLDKSAKPFLEYVKQFKQSLLIYPMLAQVDISKALLCGKQDISSPMAAGQQPDRYIGT